MNRSLQQAVESYLARRGVSVDITEVPSLVRSVARLEELLDAFVGGFMRADDESQDLPNTLTCQPTQTADDINDMIPPYEPYKSDRSRFKEDR